MLRAGVKGGGMTRPRTSFLFTNGPSCPRRESKVRRVSSHCPTATMWLTLALVDPHGLDEREQIPVLVVSVGAATEPRVQPLRDGAKLRQLLNAQAVDHQCTNGLDVGRRGRHQFLVARLREDRVGEAAVRGVGLAPDQSAGLQALDQVRQAREGRVGELGQRAHPQRVVRILRQPGQGVVLDEAEPCVALELALQGPRQLDHRRGEGAPGASSSALSQRGTWPVPVALGRSVP